MYAVIKTGGKQYRVQPGDVIVVEKLAGDAGADVSFGEVLMLGGDKGVTLGSPLIDGAAVAATLVETRKGDKIKIFKKTRRQGYRRTNGHRQMESVLRITGIDGAGESAKWDGTAQVLTKAEKNLRARGLAPRTGASDAGAADAYADERLDDQASVQTVVTDVDGPVVEAAVVEGSGIEGSAPAKPARKKAAPKAAAASDAPVADAPSDDADTANETPADKA